MEVSEDASASAQVAPAVASTIPMVTTQPVALRSVADSPEPPCSATESPAVPLRTDVESQPVPDSEFPACFDEVTVKTPSESGGIMVFYPTLEQMKDFSLFIRYMESRGAHHAGIAKVVAR